LVAAGFAFIIVRRAGLRHRIAGCCGHALAGLAAALAVAASIAIAAASTAAAAPAASAALAFVLAAFGGGSGLGFAFVLALGLLVGLGLAVGLGLLGLILDEFVGFVFRRTHQHRHGRDLLGQDRLGVLD